MSRKSKLSGKVFETDHNLDTSDIQLLEDAGNNVEVDKSLFQKMDDWSWRRMKMIQIIILQIQSMTSPTDGLSPPTERLDCHGIYGYAGTNLICLSCFLGKNNFQEGILIAFIIEINKLNLTLKQKQNHTIS